ncbi:MAG: WD40 repeat domain-containing protein [Candidatus Poribacteria bacterium]|nr:WD40 repeat domain-containing protein [Candidatus Poribacteria bacterium]
MEMTSADHALYLTFEGHQEGVNSVVFSKYGNTLAADMDNTIRLWDISTGQEKRVYWVDIGEHSTSSVRSVAISPNGCVIAGGINEIETICLWDVETTEQTNLLRETASDALHWVNTVAFSIDGKMLASGSEDGNLYLWNVTTGEKIKALTEDTENIFSIAFCPDGKTLASGAADNTIRLWDLPSGENIATLEGHTDWVFSVAVNRDGKMLASGSRDKTIRIWDTATKKEIMPLIGHQNVVWSVAFSPDGKTLASGSEDHTIRLWDIATGGQLAAITGHTAPVKCVTFSPDGSKIASSTDNGAVFIWEINV